MFNIFATNEQELDKQWANHLMILIVTTVLIGLSFWFVRPSDWLSTSLWYDSLGYNLVIPATIRISGREVSAEGFVIAVMLWGSNLLIMYIAHVCGRWWGHDPEGYDRDLWWMDFNWVKALYYLLSFMIGMGDNVTDAAWKANGVYSGSTFWWAMVFSTAYYGFFSEYILGFASKFWLVSMKMLVWDTGFMSFLGRSWKIGRHAPSHKNPNRGKGKQKRNSRQPTLTPHTASSQGSNHRKRTKQRPPQSQGNTRQRRTNPRQPQVQPYDAEIALSRLQGEVRQFNQDGTDTTPTSHRRDLES